MQKFVSVVQLHSSIMRWQHLQAPVYTSETLAVLVPHSHGAGWPHRGSRSCRLAIWDVLIYIFCTDLHSWSDQLDLTCDNLRGREESSCPPMSPHGSL